MQTNCLHNRRGWLKNLSHVKQKVFMHHWLEKWSLCSEWDEVRAQCVGYFIPGLEPVGSIGVTIRDMNNKNAQ